MLRRIIIFSIVLIAFIALGYVWYRQQQPQEILPSKAQPVSVTVATATTMTIPRVVSAIGILQAERQITVTPELAGEIVDVNYKPGTFVKEGTVLFQLDDRIYRAKLDASKAALKLAQSNYRRYQKLAKIGAQAQQVLEQAKTQFLQALAQVNTDRAYLLQTTIKAPFSGYIGPKKINIGDYVTPGQALTTLTDRSHLLVEYHLSEQLLSEIKLDQKVKIIVHNGFKQIFNGAVTYISPTIDSATHSFTVQADVPNPDNILSPGLFVHVIQNLGKTRDALVIPQQSIIPTITGAKVFIVVNGKAQSIDVKTGITFNNKIEILNGLSKGDKVVTAGQQELNDGTPVKEVTSP